MYGAATLLWSANTAHPWWSLWLLQGSQVLKTGKSDIPQTSPPPMSGGQREWGCSINNIIISVFVVNINNCSALQKKIFDTWHWHFNQIQSVYSIFEWVSEWERERERERERLWLVLFVVSVCCLFGLLYHLWCWLPFETVRLKPSHFQGHDWGQCPVQRQAVSCWGFVQTNHRKYPLSISIRMWKH